MEYYEKLQNPVSDSNTTDSESDQNRLLNSMSAPKGHIPRFEITVRRKFEIAELCEVFVGKYLKFVYLVMFTLVGFLTLWSFAIVAGSSWSINIPLNFGNAEQCSEDAFLHNTVPSGGCLYTYYFSLAIFALIVVTLSMLDLKEQAVIQSSWCHEVRNGGGYPHIFA